MQNRRSVFFVDDNPRTRNLLTSILKQSGFDVIAVGDPEEAIRFCQRAHFDLALLDYPMPILFGRPLAAEINRIHPKVPIIMISGCTTVPEYDLAFVDAHFGANTSLDDMVATMRMLLDLPRKVVPTHGNTTARWSDST